jgi:hypothetical protein
MTDIVTGSLVRHLSLGVGKVVAIEATALHVFFPQGGTRQAVKLRWPAARPFLAEDAVPPDAWLQGLNSFALDPKTGRYALGSNFVTHDDAVAEFLAAFPQGFAEPARAGGATRQDRASRWRAASAEWTQALGGGEGERLLADGDLREVVKRALRVGSHAASIRGVVEADVLAEALEPGDEAAAFFDALFKVTSGPSPARPRLERLFTVTEALGVDRDIAWPMATLFPFVADPAQHVVLLPRPACGAAARLGCDLRYKVTPNWATYRAWRTLAEQLLAKLRPHGARDFIHVESFLCALGTPAPRRKR